jgi:glycosyltransferase involved in cell wall biosynthesis
MQNKNLISVIVPTKNSADFLEACLKSVKNQSYKNIELIVVDNHSTDNTEAIAKRYADKFYSKGPERSAQRNYGVSKSKGEYVVIIDSDMELSRDVIKSCVQKVLENNEVKAVIIPEESFGKGFWAQCKKLERSFYVGIDWMEAARFFDKKLYQELGGYNENMVSGEDWDLSQRAAATGKLGRINNYIFHNEGHLKLIRTLRKKYYYAQKFAVYTSHNKQTANLSAQTGPITRYKLFFSHPIKLFKNPVLGAGMLSMKTAEFAVGAMGLILKSRGKEIK